jgi:hypothetical protein
MNSSQNKKKVVITKYAEKGNSSISTDKRIEKNYPIQSQDRTTTRFIE